MLCYSTLNLPSLDSTRETHNSFDLLIETDVNMEEEDEEETYFPFMKNVVDDTKFNDWLKSEHQNIRNHIDLLETGELIYVRLGCNTTTWKIKQIDSTNGSVSAVQMDKGGEETCNISSLDMICLEWKKINENYG